MTIALATWVAIIASAASGLLGGSGPRSPVSGQQDDTPRSEVRLVSDVGSVRPGEPFTAGLHVTLEAGWRTPWKNAGDVGSGLLANWLLPDGFTADSFAYPIPERIVGAQAASYGYQSEVVFLATITPAADIEAGQSVRLRLSADFVVCGSTCIPVSAERSLELPVRDASPEASGEAALIRRYARRVPVAHARWSTRVARTPGGLVLGVTPPADWEGSLRGAYFFPEDRVLLEHAAGQPVGRTDGEYRVRLTRSPYLRALPERIEGILVLPDGAAFDTAGHRGLIVNAPVSGTEVAWAAERTEPVTTGSDQD